jgi:hypothetical protein
MEVNLVKVWLVTVALLFAGIQLWQWLLGFILPLPIYVLGGAFLAIASNYEKGLNSLLASATTPSETLSQTATLVEATDILEPESKNNPPLPPDSSN